MRSIALRGCAAAVLLALPSVAPGEAAAPMTADEAALMHAEAMQDRWQGRRSYLYDDGYGPGTETVGGRPSDPQACVDDAMRLRRSDGSTVVRHVRRCR
jgi:hypothetical protein